MVRLLVAAFTCFATMATLSGCTSSAPTPSGPDSIETTAPHESLGDSIGDTALTAEVKLGLAFGRGVKGSNITVHTDHKIVTLTGQVDSEAERQLATRIARETEGVQDVVNRLEVRG